MTNDFACGKNVSISLKNNAKCPVCGAPFGKNEQLITCKKCATPHHIDCWEYCQGCGIFGCQKMTVCRSLVNNTNPSSTLLTSITFRILVVVSKILNMSLFIIPLIFTTLLFVAAVVPVLVVLLYLGHEVFSALAPTSMYLYCSSLIKTISHQIFWGIASLAFGYSSLGVLILMFHKFIMVGYVSLFGLSFFTDQCFKKININIPLVKSKEAICIADRINSPLLLCMNNYFIPFIKTSFALLLVFYILLSSGLYFTVGIWDISQLPALMALAMLGGRLLLVPLLSLVLTHRLTFIETLQNRIIESSKKDF